MCGCADDEPGPSVGLFVHPRRGGYLVENDIVPTVTLFALPQAASCSFSSTVRPMSVPDRTNLKGWGWKKANNFKPFTKLDDYSYTTPHGKKVVALGLHVLHTTVTRPQL